MPIAFTQEERTAIYNKLMEGARVLVKKQPARKITVGQLTRYAGISKGAFYLFFDSKELLFYTLLRQLHKELYGPAIKLLNEPAGTPAQKLCRSILAGCRVLEDSGFKRFWEEDAPEIMGAVSMSEKQDQLKAEEEAYYAFLEQSGKLRVSEALAMDAVRSLIMTVSMRPVLGPHYEQILRWMCEGVCKEIFT